MSNPFRKIIEDGLDHTISKWHHYLPLYDRYFGKYRESCSPTNKLVIVEVGVYKGGSLDMWNKYFGKENCEIYSIDIEQNARRFDTSANGGNVHILIGDQENIDFLKHIKATVPSPHILIDDGGHHMKQQINTFDQLFEHVRPGGIFLCEDTHTSYFPAYGGGLRGPYTFIEHTKGIIDHLNAYHLNDKNAISHLTKTCFGIYVYDSMVFFEKAEKEISRPVTRTWNPK